MFHPASIPHPDSGSDFWNCNEARAPLAFPFTEDAEGTALSKEFIDHSFACGIDLLVVGGFLIWASRNPDQHTLLVWLVVWTEAARIVGDAWAMTRGYPELMNWVFAGFIVFHLAVVATCFYEPRK